LKQLQKCNRSRESFGSKNGISFDALNAASIGTQLVTNLLFNPQRSSRMVQQKSMFQNQLGLDEMIDTVFESTFKKNHTNTYDNEIQQSINAVVLQNLLELCSNNNTTFQVKSITLVKVKELKDWLNQSKVKGNFYKEGYINMIDTFLKNPAQFKKERAPKIPDGSPIGSISCDLGHL
jgi:hypothetical protein